MMCVFRTARAGWAVQARILAIRVYSAGGCMEHVSRNTRRSRIGSSYLRLRVHSIVVIYSGLLASYAHLCLLRLAFLLLRLLHRLFLFLLLLPLIEILLKLAHRLLFRLRL